MMADTKGLIIEDIAPTIAHLQSLREKAHKAPDQISMTSSMIGNKTRKKGRPESRPSLPRSPPSNIGMTPAKIMIIPAAILILPALSNVYSQGIDFGPFTSQLWCIQSISGNIDPVGCSYPDLPAGTKSFASISGGNSKMTILVVTG